MPSPTSAPRPGRTWASSSTRPSGGWPSTWARRRSATGPSWPPTWASCARIPAGPDLIGPLEAATAEWLESAAAQTWLPLRALQDALHLSPSQTLAFVLAGLVEEDGGFGQLFAALQRGGRRPTVGLLGAVLGEAGEEGWALVRPLVEAGVLQVEDAAAPRSEWALRPPSALWAAVLGEAGDTPLAGTRYHPAARFAAPSALVLAAGEREHALGAAALLLGGRADTLVVRGPPGRERLELVGAIARAIGRGVLEVDEAALAPGDARAVAPLAVLLPALAVYRPELGPGESFAIPPHPAAAPVAVVLGQDGGVGGAEHAIVLTLAPEGEALRREHWQRALPDAPPADSDALAARFTLGGRYIAQAAGLARAYAGMDHRLQVGLEDVRLAARAIQRQQLDALAAPLADGCAWGDLVTHADTERDLRALFRRCRHRERMAAELGGDLPGGLGPGVRALLQGPSGTGKTLAARVLAAELGLDLYRVDLASVVNKYIGETEKNLSRVLGRAEDLDVVLLLDEGDALMGKRTDVRSANDRWANLETNYLLQRIESYAGIILVTTNAPGSIDSAFRRRMDVVVSFHLPDGPQRYALWLLHLPPDHVVGDDALEEIALRFPLTGGQIRNAAVHAALLAMDAPGGLLDRHGLLLAIEAEYRKSGAAYPGLGATAPAVGADGLDAFLSAIS